VPVAGSLLRTGTSLVSWFVENFAPPSAPGSARPVEDVLEDEAARVAPGCDGLVLLPHWNAAGTPYWDVEARGAVVGWTPGHTVPFASLHAEQANHRLSSVVSPPKASGSR
jgi:xylulokinase